MQPTNPSSPSPPSADAPEVPEVPQENKRAQSFRVMTLNIWANRGPWTARLRLIQKGLRKESPDLVALQEVLRPQGHGTSQADEIGRDLGYRVAYSRACRIDKPFPSDFGNALLTRFPIREHRTEALPTPPDVEPRSLLYVLLSVRIGVIPVFVTHLTWEPEHQPVRARQLQFIKEYVAHEMNSLPSRLPDHVRVLPPILLGDLNSIPESEEVRALGMAAGGLRFVDAWDVAGEGTGLTFAASNPYTQKHGQGINERIDYVLLGHQPDSNRAEWQVASVRLCLDEPELEVFPSDHYGVIAELRVPE